MTDNMEKLNTVMGNQLDRLDDDDLCKDSEVLDGLIKQTKAITSIAKQMVDISRVKVSRDQVLLRYRGRSTSVIESEGEDVPNESIEDKSDNEVD